MTLFSAATKALAKRHGDRVIQADSKAELLALCEEMERVYQRCERVAREVKPRNEINKQSKKRASLNRKVRSFRDEARQMVCELCHQCRADAWHEITSGPNRVKALEDKSLCLALCNICHRDVQIWPKPKQFALLYRERPEDLDLARALEVMGWGPEAITIEEVEAEFVCLEV